MPTRDGVEEEVKRDVKRLRSRLAFNTPRQMRMGESETITLLLSQHETTAELTQELEERGARGAVVAQDLPTARRMQARLTGEDFKIEALDSETQKISRTDSTQWNWRIAPTDWGKKYLHLTVAAVYDVQGEATPRTVEGYDRNITVEVTTSQRLVSYVDSVPEGIVAGVVLGILGAIGTALLGWWKGWWRRIWAGRTPGDRTRPSPPNGGGPPSGQDGAP